MFLVWAVAHWFSSREPLMAWFAATQTIVILQAASFLGYLRIYLSDILLPTDLDRLTSATVIAYVGVVYSFHLTLLREYQTSPGLWRWALGLLGGFTGVALLQAWGEVSWALRINTALASLCILTALMLVLKSKAWQGHQMTGAPQVSRHIFVWIYVLLTLLFAPVVLPFFGLVKAAEWTLNGAVFTGSVTGLLMLALLLIRSRTLEKHSFEVRLHLQVAEARADSERLQRQEQAYFCPC